MTTFPCPSCGLEVTVLYRAVRDGQPVMVCRDCWRADAAA